MVVGFSFLWEMLLLCVVGFAALPTPLGVPPLPEDPALLRAAPANTIAYVQWMGSAKADPKSTNKTERLAAEPQVHLLLEKFVDGLRTALQLEAGNDPMMARALPLAQTALARPGCLFLTKVDFDNPMATAGGIVLNLKGDAVQAGKLISDLATMAAQMGGGDVPAPKVVDNVAFMRVPLPPTAPAVSWAVNDGYLMVTVGEETPADIMRGFSGAGPGLGGNEVFASMHSKATVARPSFRSYVNLASVIERIDAAGGQELTNVLRVLGIDGARAVLSETGLEGDGFTTRSMLSLPGAPIGLMELVAQRPLADDDLAVIPADADVACAVRCDPRTLFRIVRDTTAKIDERSARNFDEMMKEFAKEFGVRMREDVLAHLGDAVTLWNAPSQGGALFTGATMAISVANIEALKTSYDKIMKRASEEIPDKQRDARGRRFRRGTYLGETTHGGKKIHYISFVGDDVPFAPSWCLTDTHLMFSLFPQMLKASIDRGNDVQTSLAGPAAALVNPPRAVAMTRLDAKSMVRTVYAVLPMLTAVATSEMMRDGFDLDIAALPTLGAIEPHLGIETSHLARISGGVMWTRTGTIPVADPMLAAALPALAGSIFVYRSAAFQREVGMRARAVEAQRAAVEAQRRAIEEALRAQQRAKKKK